MTKPKVKSAQSKEKRKKYLQGIRRIGDGLQKYGFLYGIHKVSTKPIIVREVHYSDEGITNWAELSKGKANDLLLSLQMNIITPSQITIENNEVSIKLKS